MPTSDLRSLVTSLEGIVFALDRDLHFIEIHGSAGDGVDARAAGEASPKFADAARRALAGERVTFDWQIGSHCLRTSLAPASGGGVVGEARDVTEHRRAQAQLIAADRMASVGTLTAGVAHEINNPLASALANIELALQDVDSLIAGKGGDDAQRVLQDLRDELVDVKHAAERVRQIVTDLKLFSRAAEEQRGPLDVRRVLEASLRLAWNHVRHRAALVKELAPELPEVEANESRLGQVFLNLLVNAAQAIPEGRASEHKITVAARAEGSNVFVEVTDTGEGIPPELVPRLFTAFFSTKPVGEGTGLGLSMCHRIVQGLGGDITVDSKPGATTFRVRLPAMLRAPVAAPGPSAVAAAGARAKVLVVDDDPLVGKAIQRALGREHDTLVLTSAREALERLKRGEIFDVILCDLMMPDMTGIELHDEIAKLWPAEAERMVFLTGGAFTEKARQFTASSTCLIVEKPFDTLALRAIVRERVR